MIISNALHDFLYFYGISRMDFAKKIDIDQSHLSKLLRGSQASSRTIKKIEESYNVFLVSDHSFVKKRDSTTTILSYLDSISEDVIQRTIKEYINKSSELILEGIYIPTQREKEFYLEQMKKCLDIIDEKLLIRSDNGTN